MRALMLGMSLSLFLVASASFGNDLRPTPVQGSPGTPTPQPYERPDARPLPAAPANSPSLLSDPARRPPTLDAPRTKDERLPGLEEEERRAQRQGQKSR